MGKHKTIPEHVRRPGRDSDWQQDEIEETPLTDHAGERVSSRGISADQIQRVVDQGRKTHERHATIYFVGAKEIVNDKSLADCDGIHVICDSGGNVVLTAYRNKQLHQEKQHLGQRPRRDGLKRRYRSF